jgi:hypothetical protein
MIMTQPWGDPDSARVLVIGHDPRLQRSNTIAGYALFADYYFLPQKRTGQGERQKHELASLLFDYVTDLTAGRYNPREVLVTNLCNQPLPHAPSHHTVLIPRMAAEHGLASIRSLVAGSKVKLILAMSQQVNYWLQALGFYGPVVEFLKRAEPAPRGLSAQPPYYQARADSAFPLICGKKYLADSCYALYPVLHVKQWPLIGRTYDAYARAYEACRAAIASDEAA